MSLHKKLRSAFLTLSCKRLSIARISLGDVLKLRLDHGSEYFNHLVMFAQCWPVGPTSLVEHFNDPVDSFNAGKAGRSGLLFESVLGQLHCLETHPLHRTQNLTLSDHGFSLRPGAINDYEKWTMRCRDNTFPLLIGIQAQIECTRSWK